MQDHALRGVERRDVAEGIEWVTGRNSQSNGPMSIRSPSCTAAVRRAFADPARVVVDHAEGERRAVDRQRHVGQQVWQRPDVVLMGVCRDDSVDLVGVLDQVRQIGRTASTPGRSSPPNISASRTTMPPSVSMAAQFRPIWPSPPRNVIVTGAPSGAQLRPRPASTALASISTNSLEPHRRTGRAGRQPHEQQHGLGRDRVGSEIPGLER